MFCCFIANNMRILSSSFSISERTAIFCNIFFQQFSCQFLYMVSTCHLLVSFYLKDGIVYFFVLLYSPVVCCHCTQTYYTSVHKVSYRLIVYSHNLTDIIIFALLQIV